MISDDNPDEACKKFDDTIDFFRRECKISNVVVALSCESRTYWRHSLWPAYKQQRHGGERPQSLGAVREYIKKQYKVYQIETLEADDVLGILSTSNRSIQGTKVIVSADKDMKQIPGLLYNPGDGKGLREVTREEADYFHLYQTLVGDSTDNYPGCPRIGDIRAKKILETPTWSSVVDAYIRAGKTEEDALVQGRVARILRSGEWDREEKKVNLWQPTRQ
jgi:DNA polymerase-1